MSTIAEWIGVISECCSDGRLAEVIKEIQSEAARSERERAARVCEAEAAHWDARVSDIRHVAMAAVGVLGIAAKNIRNLPDVPA